MMASSTSKAGNKPPFRTLRVMNYQSGFAFSESEVHSLDDETSAVLEWVYSVLQKWRQCLQ